MGSFRVENQLNSLIIFIHHSAVSTEHRLVADRWIDTRPCIYRAMHMHWMCVRR